LKPDFIEKIKNAYISNQEANVITFQAENEK
jgi:hypothetical protein